MPAKRNEKPDMLTLDRFEEASQIVISDELESPEDAAKRTVMTAHGLDYEASEEYEDESGNEDAAEGTDESSDEEVSEETSEDTSASE